MVMVKTVSVSLRVAQAMAELGANEYRPPSQTVDGIMDQLAAKQDMVAFSKAYVALLQFESAKADASVRRIPGKVSAYLIVRRRISVRQFTIWAKANPEWEKVIFDCIGDPGSFTIWLKTIETEMLNL